MRIALKLLPLLALLGATSLCQPLYAELNLEAVSKKMSLWPRQVTLLQDIPLKLKQPDGSTKDARIPRGTVMEVLSIQPKGVEVRFQSSSIILPAAATDLETRVQELNAKGSANPATAPTAPGQPAAGAANPGGPSEEAVRAKLEGFLADGALTSAEMRQMTKEELAVMPPEIVQKLKDAGLLDAKGQAPPPKPRPKPVLQSRELTDYIRALTSDLVVLQGNSLKPYSSSIGIRDKDFYLLVFANQSDEPAKALVEKLKDYYERVGRHSTKFEIIFLSLHPNPQSMEAFVKSTQMPWPALEYAYGRNSTEFTKYLDGKREMPQLVLTNRAGEMLSESQNAERTVNSPQEVLLDLNSLLQLPPGVFR